MASSSSARRGPERRSVLTAAAIGVLAIVTVVLSVMALTQFRGTGVPQASSTPTTTSGPSAAPTSSATPEPPATARVVPVPDRLIGAVSAERAYRAGVGACPEPAASTAVTNDGGATWQDTDAAGLTGSASALSYAALDGDFVSMVMLSADACAPQLARSYVAGTNWEVGNDQLAETWYFDARDPAVVHSPDGDRATPCQAVAVAGSGDRAAVLCADERVFATTDRGASWPASATVPGAAAIARAADGYDVATLNQNGCEGVHIVPMTADAQLQAPGACLAHPVPEGQVALSTGGDGELWLWASDRVARSGDRGATWR